MWLIGYIVVCFLLFLYNKKMASIGFITWDDSNGDKAMTLLLSYIPIINIGFIIGTTFCAMEQADWCWLNKQSSKKRWYW